MTWLRNTWDRLRGITVTPRAAALLALAVPFAAFFSPVWAWLLAIGWTIVVYVLVRIDIAASPGPNDLLVTRTVPTKLSIGVTNRITLTIRNTSRSPARIEGRETPPMGFAGDREFGPIEIAPHSVETVEFEFVPPNRGAYDFGDVGIRTLGARRLAGRQFLVPLAEEVRVYPDISAVYGYSLLARRGNLHELGIRTMRYAGVGTEFESMREYVNGDDYRDIDWKSTARAGRPIVRQFEAERSQNVVLAIDAGRLMTSQVGSLTKLDRAINAALLVSYLATEAGDNVGLFVFGRDVRTYLAPGRGHRQFLAILEALYTVEGRVEEPDYAGALRYLATRLRKRSLIVLFTELVGTEPSRRLLGVLSSLAPRHLPLVVTQRNLDIERIARDVPSGEREVFVTAVAQDLISDKAAALRVLESRGALVLDVVPEALSVAAVNRYLEVKARGRL